MVGGLLPKRHIHSFRQWTNLFASSLSTVSQSYINSCISKAEEEKKCTLFHSVCIYRSGSSSFHRTGLSSAADSGLVQPWAPCRRCWLARLCISLSWWRGKKVHPSAVAHVVLFENYERKRGNNWDKTNCTQKITPRSKNEISVLFASLWTSRGCVAEV